eukprot:482312_1
MPRDVLATRVLVGMRVLVLRQSPPLVPVTHATATHVVLVVPRDAPATRVLVEMRVHAPRLRDASNPTMPGVARLQIEPKCGRFYLRCVISCNFSMFFDGLLGDSSV